ncbi:MAG: ZIP family metal transporter, partial [Actinomycetota bacterium]|nr:ZIP family metal transporter [Actinomycetota bacterium]
RNDGPDPVTIAQVLVNDAYWQHSVTDRSLARLETATVRIAYPWDEGLPLNIALVTSTGVTIEHEIEAAALTPPVDSSTLAIYSLLGLYIGVIPVAVGLLWFPALRRVSPRVLAFFLALTVGLLAFLLIDTVAEGLEIAAETAAVLDGVGLFGIGVLVAVLVLAVTERALRRRRSELSGLALAYLIAAGIGLHNLGEGLAVGAALAAGEVALGTFLIVGFALHNTTEGLAIVSPLGLSNARPRLTHFVALGAVAGVPTIFGAWAGGFAFAPAWGSFVFGIAAGAIAQVVWTIAKSLPKENGLASTFGAAGFAVGLAVMYVTGLFTA